METQSYYVSHEGQNSLLPTEHDSGLGWDFSSSLPVFPTQLFFQQKLMDLGIFSHYTSPKLFLFKVYPTVNASAGKKKNSFSHIIFFCSENALCFLSSSAPPMLCVFPPFRHLPGVAPNVLTLLTAFHVQIVVLFATVGYVQLPHTPNSALPTPFPLHYRRSKALCHPWSP